MSLYCPLITTFRGRVGLLVIHGYTLKEIADYLETHYTTVSKAMARDGVSEK